MMKTIRLLLIEDNRLFRNGIAAMLAHQRGIKIVTASGGSKDALLKIRKLKPNVILLDLGLRSQNSLRVVELVKKGFPKAQGNCDGSRSVGGGYYALCQCRSFRFHSERLKPR